MTPDEIQKDRAAGTPLTVEILADALSCFWNAALGAAHNQQAGFDAASIMAEGVGAIANRLAEYSKEHLTLTAWNTRADLAAERERKLVEVLGLADDALTEAEAILGGEYGDHYQSLCDTMLTLRTKIASLSEELGYE